MGVRLVVHNYLYDEMDYTGTHNHDEMIHRDWVDQHPIYAISGLQEVLNTIEKNIIAINNLIVREDSLLKQYADDKDAIINKRIDNLNVVSSIKDTNTIDMSYDDTLKELSANVLLYKEPNGTNAIQETPNGLYVPKFLSKDTNSITWDIASLGEDLSEFFTKGIRFSHNNTSIWNDLYSLPETQSWYWDNDLQSIVQPINTDSYNGFVSSDLYNDYKHTARLVSSDIDNDANGLVIAYVKDEQGHTHTLSAMIQRDGNTYLNYRFAIIYNFRLPGQTLVKTYNLHDSTGGWNTQPNGITLYVKKFSNLIDVSATTWNFDNQFTDISELDDAAFEYTLSLDLDDYSWGYLFRDKVRYGYGNLSQPASYFDHIMFYSTNKHSSLNTFANVKIDPDENNSISVNENGLFSQKFIISEDENNALVHRENGYFVQKTPLLLSNTRLNGLIEETDDTYYVHKSHSFIDVEQEDHGFEVGDFIYYDTRTILYQKALAKDSFDINIVGMVSYIYDKDKFEYICSGFVETDIFVEKNGYVQGMPLYISAEEPGKVTQTQPDISKAVGYPVADKGVIISIERGIQYNQETSIGDFKVSANDYNIRSDGFIKVTENIDYKLSLVQKLLNTLDVDFIANYLIVDYENNIVQFTNIDVLYELNDVKTGLNLFIKAF